ncbi:MAG: hypothetical protein ACI856_000699, partial [Kiritimatiellia bacterium]
TAKTTLLPGIHFHDQPTRLRRAIKIKDLHYDPRLDDRRQPVSHLVFGFWFLGFPRRGSDDS